MDIIISPNEIVLKAITMTTPEMLNALDTESAQLILEMLLKDYKESEENV